MSNEFEVVRGPGPANIEQVAAKTMHSMHGVLAFAEDSGEVILAYAPGEWCIAYKLSEGDE